MAPRSGRRGPPPDFVIIGAQRCGTTTLYEALAGHPEVAPAAEKELHFFDLHWDRGVGWYRSRFEAPRGIFRRRRLTGEASPYYVFHPHAPARMASVVPEARLIVLLRNPVDRAFSHYKHEVAMGCEDLPFAEAVAREPERLAGEVERMLADGGYYSYAHQHHSYLARGRYAEQLPAWLDRFGERLLILRSEDLYADPPAVVSGVLGFLGLSDPGPTEIAAENVSERLDLEAGMRSRLAEHFRPHNRRLEELLGRRFGWDDG